MNKLLIVGHPTSGLQELGPALRRLGFFPPLPSLRENRRPEDLLAGLRRSLDLPEPGQPSTDGEFKQMHPGQAWQGLVSDLILGNQNQGPWFWSSPGLLPFLSFCRSQDPGFLIVMIYDLPHRALDGSSREAMAAGSLRQRIETWESYNSAMLEFHRQHRDHSLLVHGGAVLEDPAAFASLIREKAGTDLPDARESAMEGFRQHGTPVRKTGPAEHFLQDACLAGFPRAEMIYQELEASSSLKSGPPVDRPSPEEALADLVAYRAAVNTRLEEELARESARRIWDLQLAEIQEALEKNYLETQGYKWRLGQAERQLQAPHGAAERVKQQLAYRVGSVIVSGTRSVSGFILMPFVLLVEILHFGITRIRSRKQKLPPLRDYADFQAGEKVKNQLSYRIGRAVLQNLKSPAGWVRMPAAVSGEIKEFRKSRHKEKVAPETA